MSQLRQRLLPIAGLSLGLVGFLRRALRANLFERLESGRHLLLERLGCSAALERMNEPVSDALVRISEGSRALMTLPAKGRALVQLMPEPVQLELKKLSTRGAHVCREIFAGILVVGLIVIVAGYGRLGRGPISLPSLVPGIEEAINGQLTDLRVKIDDAILQRSNDGPGVLFRLRNIRLIDRDGSVVAQAPLAAIGMSGAALLSGRIAPGSVDFIGPRLLFYASDDGLSLSFYRPANGDADAFMRGSVLPGGPTGGESVVAKRSTLPPPVTAGRKLDVTRTITDVFERARRGNSSYLTRFGVKDAEVVLSQDGVQTLWEVPDFSVDLAHKDEKSVLIGQASLASDKGDWKLDFRTEQRSLRHSLAITALIENLVPSGLASTFPSVTALKAFDLPVTGETNAEFSNSGRFLSGGAKLRLEPGSITPPWDRDNTMRIDSGTLNLRYTKKDDLVEIEPSTLKWGQSQATFSGEFRRTNDDTERPDWAFTLKADNAVLAAEEFGLAPMKVDEWSAQGLVNPADGRLVLSRFVIRSGNASIDLAGSVADAPGSPEIHLTGSVSPMPLDEILKRFWPKFLAGDARKWAMTNVAGGQVLGGKVSISLKPGELARIEQGGEPAPDAINVDLALAGMDITYIEKMPPVRTGAANMKVAGTTFAMDIPQGKVVLPSGEEIPLADGHFFIGDLRQDPQQAELTFRGGGATTAVLQLLDHEPLGYVRAVGLKPEYFGGTASGSFDLSMPMREDLNFSYVKLQGTGRLQQAIATDVFGKVDVEGGALDVNITEQSAEVKGPILIKGVPAALSWQRIFDQPEANQPPVRITAVLDQAQREALGLKVSHLVQGTMPVELSIRRDAQGGQTLSLQGDLTNTKLIFGNMGWTKPAGRAASVQFDVAQEADGATDLNNFRISGDDIAINGSISLDPQQHLKGFYFSDFSFDQLTHVEISATVRDDVLNVEAHGPSYDGRQFFQSLFAAGQLAEGGEAADPFSVDLSARLGSVAGFYDTNLTDVQLTAKKRNGKLVALNASGKFGGKVPVTVDLDNNKGMRRVRAESGDAGAAFRLIGFYPKVSGGQASLEVNLDAEESSGLKSGTLWANNFDVLGDFVVSDVLTDPQSTAALGTANNNKKKEVRQTRLSFEKLRAPFAVGKGEFMLNDAYVNGPLLGATMRGRVNFKTQTVNLGGTYVPLYGLNSALGNIPILGGIFVGRQGEGVVGITFAIQGSLDNPDVLVNPISVVAPGIFRQIFEFRAEGQNAATSAAQPSTKAPSDFSSAAGGGGR